jgi:hypothetical protein
MNRLVSQAVNQRGSVILISLLPILFTMLIVLAAVSLTLHNWRLSHHACRDTLLRVEETLHDVTVKIMAMNPLALALRLERQHAEKLLRNAREPVTAAAAAANLLRVILKQKSFRAKQESLKLTALNESRRLLSNLSHQLKAWPTQAQEVSVSSAHLAFRLSPPLTITPDHHRDFAYSRKMRVEARWSFEPLGPQWQWIQRLLPAATDLHGQCAATILKKEKQWFPSLVKVSSWLS